MLIDAGCGDKMDAKSAEIYGLDRDYHLDHSLREAGVAPDDIDIVAGQPPALRSRRRLHGARARMAGRSALPASARYVAHRGEWDDATHPHERNRASYLPENFVPLAEAGVLDLVDDDAEIMPGVRYRRSGGHTRHHQVVMIESRGRTAVFTADMYPDVRPRARSVDHGLRPVSDGHAGVQARVCA